MNVVHRLKTEGYVNTPSPSSTSALCAHGRLRSRLFTAVQTSEFVSTVQVGVVGTLSCKNHRADKYSLRASTHSIPALLAEEQTVGFSIVPAKRRTLR